MLEEAASAWPSSGGWYDTSVDVETRGVFEHDRPWGRRLL